MSHLSIDPGDPGNATRGGDHTDTCSPTHKDEVLKEEEAGAQRVADESALIHRSSWNGHCINNNGLVVLRRWRLYIEGASGGDTLRNGGSHHLAVWRPDGDAVARLAPLGHRNRNRLRRGNGLRCARCMRDGDDARRLDECGGDGDARARRGRDGDGRSVPAT
eukprot:scaffold109687_cov28-Tisochrysis_lutea.AAC.2